MEVEMKIFGPNGVQELRRFPGMSALKLAMKILLHPTYTIIICESDDWYSDIKIDVDNDLKVIRIREQK